MPSQAFAIPNPTGVSRPSRLRPCQKTGRSPKFMLIFRETGEHTYLYVENGLEHGSRGPVIPAVWFRW